MVSKLEVKIWKLDDERETINKSAKRIAETLEVNQRTAMAYISAKRRGFSSYDDYKTNLVPRLRPN